MLATGECTPEDLCFSLQVMEWKAGTETWSWRSFYVVDRAKLGLSLMFSPCLPSTGNCVCNAGRDHRASHGTLWLPGGPHRGRCGVYVSLNCASLSYFGACVSSSWYSKSLRVWGNNSFYFLSNASHSLPLESLLRFPKSVHMRCTARLWRNG